MPKPPPTCDSCTWIEDGVRPSMRDSSSDCGAAPWRRRAARAGRARRRSGRLRRAPPSGTPEWRPIASSSSTTRGAVAQHRVDVAVALADDRHLGVAAGRELAGLGLGGEQDRQLLDLDGDEIGRVLRHVGVARRTPRRPARRRSAPCRWRAPAGDRDRARECCPRGSRSAARRRCRPRSRPRPRRARRARPSASIETIRPCAWFERTTRMWSWCGKEMSPAKRPWPRTSGGSSSRVTDWPIHLLSDAVIGVRPSSWPRRRVPISRCSRSRCSGRDWTTSTSSRSSSLMSGSRSSTPAASIRKPGVQKPHCRPWLSMNACCSGCSSSPLRQAFDGADFAAFGLHREHQARAHRLAVEQHRAGAADAVLAADMGSGLAAFVADRVHQRAARIDAHAVAAAVDVEGDLALLAHAAACSSARRVTVRVRSRR